jgi:hypothetical protein
LSELHEKARTSLAENIDRLRLLSEDWQLGGADGFARDVRALGDSLAMAEKGYSEHSRREVRRIFNAIANLLDDVQELGGKGVVDPDYDGAPNEVTDSGPTTSPEHIAAQDKDR